ncbi:unnamed protein product [Lactuca virosa]|uniref:non-specific serine/threonine protein kinase n=1 Tax=Lactuca virosa TaxID=75947 RepID=A0AAU9MEY3_9ASTR|nr:unnamed protein product [Lactuca virosa]
MPAIEDAGDGLPSTAEKTLFGKYEVGRLLGYGAFAKVYHARDVQTEKSVAIKVINKQRILKGGLAANVKREISIMRRLRHPNIVRLLEVLANKKKIYFVLEFAKGGELFAKVAKSRFSEHLSRRYFQQLISAVGSDGADPTRWTPPHALRDPCLRCTGDFVEERLRWCKGGYLVLRHHLVRPQRRWTSPDLKRLISRLLDTNPQTRITVDEIINDPWFKIGYKEVEFHCDHLELKDDDDDGDSATSTSTGDNLKVMNAFDIISYSSGYNLSRLLDDREVGERFLSKDSPEKIIEKVVEVAEGENLTVVTRKGWCVKVVGGYNCNFVMAVEIKRLTEELVVVEVRRIESEFPSRDCLPNRDSQIETHEEATPLRRQQSILRPQVHPSPACLRQRRSPPLHSRFHQMGKMMQK